MTPRASTNETPFNKAFGIEVMIIAKIELPAMQIKSLMSQATRDDYEPILTY